MIQGVVLRIGVTVEDLDPQPTVALVEVRRHAPARPRDGFGARIRLNAFQTHRFDVALDAFLRCVQSTRQIDRVLSAADVGCELEATQAARYAAAMLSSAGATPIATPSAASTVRPV